MEEYKAIQRNKQDDNKGGKTDEDQLDSDCPICLQPFLHPVRLPCNHVFCYLCCKGEVLKRKRCAMCRSEIPQEYFYDPNLIEESEQDKELSFENDYQWFYEGKNGWWQYDERSSAEIEQNFNKGEKSIEILIAGHLYVINYEQMRQHRNNAPGRFRKIKRDLCSVPKKGVAGLKINRVLPDVPDTRSAAEGNETEKDDQAQGTTPPQPNPTTKDTSSNVDVRAEVDRSITGPNLNAGIANRQTADTLNRHDMDNQNSADEYVFLQSPRRLRDRQNNESVTDPLDDSDSGIRTRTVQSPAIRPITRPRTGVSTSRTMIGSESRDRNESRHRLPRMTLANNNEDLDLVRDTTGVQRRSLSRLQTGESTGNVQSNSNESIRQRVEERPIASSVASGSIENRDSMLTSESPAHSKKSSPKIKDKKKKKSERRDQV